MTRRALRQRAAQLRAESRRWPKFLVEIPRDDWPEMSRLAPKNRPVRVWRSRRFLVQQFEIGDEPTRLTVSVADLEAGGRWKSGISWDALQEIKSQCGFGDQEAVEVFPRDQDLVDVQNMRHVWILPEGHGLTCFWRRA